jgi:hypothetical protein
MYMYEYYLQIELDKERETQSMPVLSLLHRLHLISVSTAAQRIPSHIRMSPRSGRVETSCNSSRHEPIYHRLE